MHIGTRGHDFAGVCFGDFEDGFEHFFLLFIDGVGFVVFFDGGENFLGYFGFGIFIEVGTRDATNNGIEDGKKHENW